MFSERQKSRLILLAIPGVFLAFFIAGRYFVNVDDMALTNRGSLIIPHVAVANLSLQHEDGRPFTTDELAPWGLIYLAESHCDTACRNGIFYGMHQLRKTLDHHGTQLALIIVHTATPDADMQRFLSETGQQMLPLYADATQLRQQLSGSEGLPEDPLGKIYVSSPDGYLFLWYPTHTEMSATLQEADNMHADLKRTLKGARRD